MRFTQTALFVAAWTVFTAVSARADYDMSGKWLLLGPTGSVAGRMTVTQAGGELSVPAEGGSVPWSGTINEMTGEFHLNPAFYAFPMCSTWTIDGTVAADGRSFTAIRHTGGFTGSTPHTLQCITTTIAIEGTRCGNTVLEDFEDCDLGDATDGDCCSSSCLFDVDGTICTSDGNVCTDDLCDGAGVCSSEPRTGPCTLPGGCGSGDCSEGTCVVTSSLPAGTSCDLDASVCTPDTCADGGTCVAGSSIDCSPCGTCDDEDGCIAYEMDCDTDPEAIKVSLRAGEDPARRSIKMSIARSDLNPDPTLGFDMAVCLFEEQGGVSRPVLNARVPADGPWEAKSDGRWVYKDKTRAASGVLAMTMDPERGFKVVAGRENLPLSLDLPVDSPLTARISLEHEVPFPYVNVCIEQSLATEKQSDTKYKGSFSAAP